MTIEREKNKECPFCQSAIRVDDEFVPCPKCGVEHHVECWGRNGKCSIHGCDGWAAWNGAIARKMAPKLDTSVDLSASDCVDAAELEPRARTAGTATAQVPKVERCIKCGAEVPAQTLLCGRCRGGPSHLWENCSGPALLFLGGIVAIITLITRVLT